MFSSFFMFFFPLLAFFLWYLDEKNFKAGYSRLKKKAEEDSKGAVGIYENSQYYSGPLETLRAPQE
jgi:hypothetical protein